MKFSWSVPCANLTQALRKSKSTHCYHKSNDHWEQSLFLLCLPVKRQNAPTQLYSTSLLAWMLAMAFRSPLVWFAEFQLDEEKLEVYSSIAAINKYMFETFRKSSRSVWKFLLFLVKLAPCTSSLSQLGSCLLANIASGSAIAKCGTCSLVGRALFHCNREVAAVSASVAWGMAIMIAWLHPPMIACLDRFLREHKKPFSSYPARQRVPLRKRSSKAIELREQGKGMTPN